MKIQRRADNNSLRVEGGTGVFVIGTISGRKHYWVLSEKAHNYWDGDWVPDKDKILKQLIDHKLGLYNSSFDKYFNEVEFLLIEDAIL